MTDAPETAAAAAPADSITVTLKKPIQAHGETLKKLTLSDPDLGALDGIYIDVGEQGARIHLGQLPLLLAAMANIPPSAAKTIKLTDLAVIGPEVFAFLGLSLGTGES